MKNNSSTHVKAEVRDVANKVGGGQIWGTSHAMFTNVDLKETLGLGVWLKWARPWVQTQVLQKKQNKTKKSYICVTSAKEVGARRGGSHL
jgi:hypothetical protein